MFVSRITPSPLPSEKAFQAAANPERTRKSDEVLPRFANAAIIQSAVGSGTPLIQKLMAPIQASKFKELVITDVGALVTPNTTIELYKRGIAPGREEGINQTAGLLTNTFLAGWLGYICLLSFGMMANPKGMDLKTGIDTNLLEAFGKITDEVLATSKSLTPQQLREKFLQAALSRLKSTANIPAQFSQYFHGKALEGMLDEPHIQYLTDRFLGRKTAEGFYAHQAYNVEELIAERIRQPEIREEMNQAIRARYAKVQEKVKKGKINAVQAGRELAYINQTERTKLIQRYRKIITRNIRANEKEFLKRLGEYAIQKGQLIDTVFLLDSQGKPFMGPRATADILRKLKYFMEEFLNRALSETGAIRKNAVNHSALRQSLFDWGGENWLRKKFVPSAYEGLLPYAYKFKYRTVLLPLLITIGLGCSAVLFNFWITRRRSGGKGFPGEEVFKEQLQASGGKQT